MKRRTILVLWISSWIALALGICPQSAPVAAGAPAAQTTAAWTGTYFANRTLQGSPDDGGGPDLNFAWGSNAPDPGLPADGFSARWTRWLYIDNPGTWTFTLTSDNGVRLLIDDTLVLDAWADQAVTAHTAAVSLTQAFHLVRVEYYHRGSGAELHLLTISSSFPDWRGEYYGNLNLQGTPAFVRDDAQINVNFGTTGPGGGVSGENFSVRWLHALYLDAGRYRFTTLTDDGVRLWVDNQLLVDQWRDQMPANRPGDVTLSAGYHLVKMEYFNHGGTGSAVLTWTPVPGSAEVWHGEYFNNAGLTGTTALVRDDATLGYDWGTTSPGKGISSGTNWSARFTSRRSAPLEGYYTVNATADDGVRVWVDNALVVDQWHDAAPTTYAATVYLKAGAHDWRVEYYQHSGSASLNVQINAGVISPPPAIALPPSAAQASVDDAGSGFLKGGSSAEWHDYPAGYGNHSLWVQNNTFSQALYNWARWYAPVTRAGFYEVSVYIPANIATTRSARYWVAHAGTFHNNTVNQALYANQLVSLGTYFFTGTGGEYVSVSDITYEPQHSTVVAVDAVRFTPR